MLYNLGFGLLGFWFQENDYMEVSRDLLRLCLPGLSLAELEDILDFLYLVEDILNFFFFFFEKQGYFKLCIMEYFNNLTKRKL